MTDVDDRLRRLFAQDEPPRRDPLFTVAVMARVARRRFLADLGVLSVLTLLGGVVLWSAWPALATNLVPLGEALSPVIACFTMGVTAVILLEGRVTAARGLKHG